MTVNETLYSIKLAWCCRVEVGKVPDTSMTTENSELTTEMAGSNNKGTNNLVKIPPQILRPLAYNYNKQLNEKITYVLVLHIFGCLVDFDKVRWHIRSSQLFLSVSMSLCIPK